MAKAKQGKSNGWRNRIVESGELPANQFLPHELNARRHPNYQREALRGSLNEIGWVEPVVISKRSGKLLDGHARIEEALSKDENSPVPFVAVDVTEEEEQLILATLDPIAALAVYEQQAQEELLAGLEAEDQALEALLEQQRAEIEQVKAGRESASSDREGMTASKHGVVKIAISSKEIGLIEKAIYSTGEKNRGEALTEICREYLNAKGQFDISTEADLAA